jgi:hypothetical protein
MLPLPLVLEAVEPGVKPVLRDQFIVPSFLRHPAAGKHQDAIRVAYGGKPVGEGNAGVTGTEFA